MNTIDGFIRGQANRGQERMVFDWNRAASLIREAGAKEASAGLSGDWEWTGGTIYAEGAPVLDGGAYLASTWATPEIDGVTHDCYRMESETPGWGSGTVWPASALATLRGEVIDVELVVAMIEAKE